MEQLLHIFRDPNMRVFSQDASNLWLNALKRCKTVSCVCTSQGHRDGQNNPAKMCAEIRRDRQKKKKEEMGDYN